MFFFILFLFLIDQTYSCPLTDEYLSRCHCGILTNGESYIKCEENSLNELPKFKRSFPYDELLLINNNIKYLNSTAFDNIKTIKRINFQGNSLSFIDDNLLRLLGNYLEELILTGDDHINSLEFLTRYPLKKLRLLKLTNFNLTKVNFQNLFTNMTKLESLSLMSCQLKHIPIIPHIQILNIENNSLSNTIFLSTKYQQINLSNNNISSIILQNNENLISLNLSKNHLNEFYSSTISNKKLQSLDLNSNQLFYIDWSILNENLTYLNLSYNQFTHINFNLLPKSLLKLDLYSNQLKTIEKNLLFKKLNYLNLQKNPFECNCQLKWLTNLSNIHWKCSAKDFQCQIMPRVVSFNITYLNSGLFIQWIINDRLQTINYKQISIEPPYRLSRKIFTNQTKMFIKKNIEINKKYHICLILVHKYAKDRYCRDIKTNNSVESLTKFQENDEHLFEEEEEESDQTTTITTMIMKTTDQHVYLLLIGSCIGGILTFILLLTCCYLCYQIHQYRISNQKPAYEKCLQHPIYHTYPSCQLHHHRQQQQMIYNSENISNSTDCSHIDTSLSTTNNNNVKHIYQTIDSQDYCSLNREQHQHLFELWNQSLKQNR